MVDVSYTQSIRERGAQGVRRGSVPMMDMFLIRSRLLMRARSWSRVKVGMRCELLMGFSYGGGVSPRSPLRRKGKVGVELVAAGCRDARLVDHFGVKRRDRG